MIFFARLLFLKLILTPCFCFAEQRIIIWDCDGTIIDQNKRDNAILPYVEATMHEEETINIVCSGIRTLHPHTQRTKKKTAYDPQKDIEKFTQLMNILPIKATVFSYALDGHECWALIKTDTGIEVRAAHEDARYNHLIGYFQKPDTGMLFVIQDLLHEWGIITKGLLFIGDTVQDQKAAETFGLPFAHASSIHENIYKKMTS